MSVASSGGESGTPVEAGKPSCRHAPHQRSGGGRVARPSGEGGALGTSDPSSPDTMRRGGPIARAVVRSPANGVSLRRRKRRLGRGEKEP